AVRAGRWSRGAAGRGGLRPVPATFGAGPCPPEAALPSPPGRSRRRPARSSGGPPVFRHVLLMAGAALLFALPARAADPQIKFEKYQMPNGLTVILAEDHRLPQVAVDIWYHVGAANQTKGKSGFAHLFEHMMFSGAKHIGPTPFKILEGIGTTGGAMANGTTNFDRTNYFEVVPSNELPTALWMESDRMAFLLDTLDEKKLAIQRNVVSNERRQSFENRPYGTALLGLMGDFQPDTAKKLVEQYFGPIPRGPEVPVPAPNQPALAKEIRETVNDKVAEVPKLGIAWTGVRAMTPEEPAGEMLASILGDGRTCRLYKRLVLEKKLAAGVDAANTTTRIAGIFNVDVVANAGFTNEQLLPEVQAILDDVKKNGVTEAELERAKRKVTAARLREVERIGGFGGKADLLNAYEMNAGDPGFLPKDLARYRAVTAQQVKDFANAYLPDDHRLIQFVVPAAKTAER